MFQQNPHPLYNSLLNHDYLLKSTNDPDVFELICNNEILNVSQEYGILYINDIKNKKRSLFTHHKFNKINDPTAIFEYVKEFVSIVRQSLIPQNIEAMNLVICEILQNFPNTQEIEFNTGDGLPNLRFCTESFLSYSINIENIIDSIYNFQFINNLTLEENIKIKEIPKHKFLENIKKYEELKKVLKVNPVIHNK